MLFYGSVGGKRRIKKNIVHFHRISYVNFLNKKKKVNKDTRTYIQKETKIRTVYKRMRERNLNKLITLNFSLNFKELLHTPPARTMKNLTCKFVNKKINKYRKHMSRLFQ